MSSTGHRKEAQAVWTIKGMNDPLELEPLRIPGDSYVHQSEPGALSGVCKWGLQATLLFGLQKG